MHSQDKEQENLQWVIPQDDIGRKRSGKQFISALYGLLTVTEMYKGAISLSHLNVIVI